MHINAGEISKIIKEQIQNYEQRVDATETGTVLSVGDGIARVYGVQNAMSMELLEFPGGLLGMVLNLEEDNVGIALLGEDTALKKRSGQTYRPHLLRADRRCRHGARSEPPRYARRRSRTG